MSDSSFRTANPPSDTDAFVRSFSRVDQARTHLLETSFYGIPDPGENRIICVTQLWRVREWIARARVAAYSVDLLRQQLLLYRKLETLAPQGAREYKVIRRIRIDTDRRLTQAHASTAGQMLGNLWVLVLISTVPTFGVVVFQLAVGAQFAAIGVACFLVYAPFSLLMFQWASAGRIVESHMQRHVHDALTQHWRAVVLEGEVPLFSRRRHELRLILVLIALAAAGGWGLGSALDAVLPD